jgi:hypothetical protein
MFKFFALSISVLKASHIKELVDKSGVFDFPSGAWLNLLTSYFSNSPANTWQNMHVDDMIEYVRKEGYTFPSLGGTLLLASELMAARDHPESTKEAIRDLCRDMWDDFWRDVGYLEKKPSLVIQNYRIHQVSNPWQSKLEDGKWANLNLVCNSLPIEAKWMIISHRIIRLFIDENFFEDLMDFQWTFPIDSTLNEYLFFLSHVPSDWLRLSLDIRFDGNPAIGIGVYRDWLIKVSRMIFESNLFIAQENGKYLFANDSETWKHRAIGRLLALMIVEGLPIGVEMSLSVYCIILGQKKFHLDDLDDVQYQTSLRQVLKCKERGDCDKLMFTFESSDGRNLRNPKDVSGSIEEVSASNVDEYVELMVQYIMYESRREIYEALYRGFDEVLPWTIFSGLVDSRELAVILKGKSTVEFDEFKSRIIFDYFYNKSEIQEWFFNFIQQGGSDRIMKFIRFATGLETLPVGGISAIVKIQVYIINFSPTDPMPKAHLCTSSVDLPYYSTEAELRDRLDEAILQTDLGII